MLKEVKQLLRLAWPIFIAQLSLSSMSMVDTIMAGHYNKLDLAAIAIGGSIWLPALLFAQGCLFGLTPMIAQAVGRGEGSESKILLHQGIYLGFFIGLMVAIGVYLILPYLSRLNIDVNLLQVSQSYLSWIILGLPFAGMYQAMRGFVEGHAKTKPIMVINILALLANIPLNYIFIFGKLGMPEMGGAGCGLATALVLLLMMVFNGLYIGLSPLKKKAQLLTFCAVDFSKQVSLIKIGLPIGLSVLAEVGIFAILALLIAPLGAEVVAGHQVALNLSAQTFMLPLSIGTALTIRVGFFVGQQNIPRLKKTISAGFILGILGSVITAGFMFFAAASIAALYSSDVGVQRIAISLLFFAAIYQLPDALQICSAGILRGFKKTTVAMVSIITAYWVIALPLGYQLAFKDSIVPAMGASGLWLALVIGLSITAVFLLSQLLWVFKRLDHQVRLANG
ncbi:MAG: MATE family efflux transporter [Pseudomonadales bacterium]|nr:MATE family efflux transporter [Pseudomonadales bacterium]